MVRNSGNSEGKKKYTKKHTQEEVDKAMIEAKAQTEAATLKAVQAILANNMNAQGGNSTLNGPFETR